MKILAQSLQPRHALFSTAWSPNDLSAALTMFTNLTVMYSSSDTVKLGQPFYNKKRIESDFFYVGWVIFSSADRIR